MSFRQLTYFLLLFTGTTLNAQDLKFKTIALSNVRFITADNWHPLTTDSDGEDANSKKYGIIYPAQQDGSDLIITQTTIAQERLDIKAEIFNGTGEYWNLEKITIEIVGEFPVADFDTNDGIWLSSKIKTISYVPRFEITDKLVDFPPDMDMGPSRDFSDNRFWITVLCPELSSDEKIYAFQFNCILKSRTDSRTLLINSDKIYLLASG